MLHIFKKILLNAGNYVEMQVSKFYNTIKKEGTSMSYEETNAQLSFLTLMKHRLLKSKLKSKSRRNAYNILGSPCSHCPSLNVIT